MTPNYICKIPTVPEMNIKWDYEIIQHQQDKENWIFWKEQNIKRYQKKSILPYYGILDGNIICEATAVFDPKAVQNHQGLVDRQTVYLSAFRTIKKQQGKGYFSKLFHFMMEDLKQRGYTKATLGVESEDIKNKALYFRYGFTNFIKSGKEIYPDGTILEVEYYAKNLL